jgi:benzodiazapine receptor
LTTAARSALELAGWLALCFAAAALGAVATVDAPAFYGALHRPSWAPPAGVFAPVWTVLYTLMAIAAWRVGQARAQQSVRAPLALFVAQLAANVLWSWLFFAAHRGAAALVEVGLLWVLILATIVAFRRVRPLAAALLLPYLVWVTFAAALNAALWRANPALLG